MDRDPRIGEPFYIDEKKHFPEQYRLMESGNKPGRKEDELSYTIRHLKPGQAMLVRCDNWDDLRVKERIRARANFIKVKTGGSYRVVIDRQQEGICVIRKPEASNWGIEILGDRACTTIKS